MKPSFVRWIPVMLVFFITAAMLHRDETAANRLEFTRRSVDYSSVLAGRQAGIVYIHNYGNRPIKDILLRTSCFCTEVDRPLIIPVVAAHETIPIPFHVDCSKLGNMLESITAVSGNIATTIPIRIHVVSPILGDINVLSIGELHRIGHGFETSSKMTTITMAPGIHDIQVAPVPSWLHISTSMTSNGICRLKINAAGDAPDGDISTAAALQFRTANGLSQVVLPLVGKIVSQIDINPPQAYFGVVHQGQQIQPVTCLISTQHIVRGSIQVMNSEPCVSAKIHEEGTKKLRLQFTLLPTKPGSISGTIHLEQHGQMLVAIPYSAFVLAK